MSLQFTRLSETHDRHQAADGSDRDVPVLGDTARPTNVSRLLSVSGIIVALTIAGSLVVENIVRRADYPGIAPPKLAAEATMPATAQPAPVEPASIMPAPVEAPVQTDQTRINMMLRRLTLLERQTIAQQTETKTGRENSAELVSRVATLEARIETLETELAAVKARPEAKPGPQVMSQAPAYRPHPALERVTMAPPPEPDPVIPEAAQASGDDIHTGSLGPAKFVKADPPPEMDLADLVKPEVRAASSQKVLQTRFALSLNLHQDIDGVRAAWTKFSAAHGDLLKNLEPRALPQGTQDGVLMQRLVVGPFSNAAAAANRCAKLRSRGIKCTTSVFGGEQLNAPPSPGTLIKVEVVAAGPPDTPTLSARARALLANPPLPRPKPAL